MTNYIYTLEVSTLNRLENLEYVSEKQQNRSSQLIGT